MKRVVNGHFIDPNSTRDIVEITPSEWEDFSNELAYIAENAKRMKNSDWKSGMQGIIDASEKVRNGEIVSEMMLEQLKTLDIDQIKQSFEHPEFENILISIYESRIQTSESLLLKSKKHDDGSWSITGITPQEYEVLITSIQEALMCYTGIIDNYNHGAIDFATGVMKTLLGENATDGLRSHPSMKGIEDNNEYRIAKYEFAEKMIPICTGWLYALNQPYEGAEY